MPDFGLTKAITKQVLKKGAVKPIAAAIVKPEVKAAVKPSVERVVTKPATVAADVGQVETATANRLAAANLGEFDLGASWQPNFDMMHTTDDVKAIIAETAEQNKAKITEARRGVVTHEQLKEFAGELDVEEDVVRKIMERESGGVINAETVVAARQVLHSSANRVKDLGAMIRAGTATDIDRLKFRRQFDFHADYLRSFMGARAEAGRSVNAFGIPVGDDPAELKRFMQIADTMHGHDTDKLAEIVGQVDSINGVNRLTREYSRSRVMGVAQELFVNSILSSVRTHEVNAFGNALFAAMNVAERGVAARIGRFMSGDEHVMVGEASAQMYGMLSGWKDSLRLAGKAFRTGKASDAAAKYETQTHRAISSANLLPADAPIGLARAIDGIGTFLRIPTERTMLPVDEFFKSMGNRAEISRLAYLDAMKAARAQPMNEAEIGEHIRQYIESPPPGALTSAGNYARYVTFQDPLGPAGKGVLRALNMIPGGRLIAPFIQTPGKLLKAGLFERSPLAVFSAEFRSALREGGPRRDLALARVSMGSLTVGTVALAVSSGTVTGGGPQDPDARKILEATGWQPYSVVFTDPTTGKTRYQSFARAEPFAYVVGATADAVEMLSYADYDDELKTDKERFDLVAASLIAGVANNTMSKTFMSGVMDFSEMLGDPKRYAANWAGNMAGAFIPYSAFRRDLSRIQDPYVREAWTFNDRIQVSSGIPGYSKDAPPKRDMFGQPIRYRGGSLIGIMSPFPDSTAKRDPVLNEIERVMTSIREVPIGMPAKRIEGMPLEAREYDELVKISRTEPLFDGNTFKEELADVFASDAYLDATDDYKKVLIKDVQQRADKSARAILEERNQLFAERLASFRLRKSARLFGDEAEGVP